jgi:PAS domain S-box-containing protein
MVTVTEAVPVVNATGEAALLREVVEVVPVATAVLDRAGIVTVANRAFADLLQVRATQLVGEPFLGWLARASEREGFGRAFIGLRAKEVGHGFVLDAGLLARLGPRVDCVIRANRLSDGHVAVTCHRTSVNAVEPEAELGLAVTRSLDALDQGVLLVDLETKVVHANPAAIKLLGDRIIGRSFLELSDPGHVSILTRALTVARTGSWQGEVELRRLDGEPLPVELSVAAGTGPAVVLLRDLRERRRRAFEERLVGQVDRCLVGAAEPRQSLTAACAAVARGLAADRVIILVRVGETWERWAVHGQVVQAPAVLQIAPPSDWTDAETPQAIAVADPDACREYGLQSDCRGLRTTLRAPGGAVGHLLLVEGAEPWDERDQTLVAVVASQIALGLAHGLLTLETRELASYQARLLDQTTVLLASVDAEGRVVTWNRASDQMLGVSPQDAMGRRLGIDVARAADAAGWSDFWAELVSAGEVAREITLLDEPTGREVPLHLEARVLRDGEAVKGAVLVGLDLRERRGLELQILRSQKLAAVGLLAAGIAHEINNPLSGVVGYSKLLLEKPDLSTNVREKVQKIADSGERCRKIVEGVLLFSRQQDGERRKVDVRALLDRVLAIGEYQWRMHNIRIIREHNESVEVMADVDQIEQVLLNLLSNAADAMPRGGSVRISLRRGSDGGARLSVADEGHGIPEEIQARIFDPFFSTKEIGKGTGLGLAISYGIVQDHGGDIVVDSTPGRGAEFTVTLPASGNPNPPPSEASR